MKSFWKIIVAACVFVSFSCRKEIPLPDPSFKKLFGQWEWLRSYSVQNHEVLTPESEGYERVIEFRRDGMYWHYRSDRAAAKMVFHFEKKDDDGAALPVYEIVYNPGRLNKFSVAPQLFYFRGDDTLVLHDDCGRDYQHVYVRR